MKILEMKGLHEERNFQSFHIGDTAGGRCRGRSAQPCIGILRGTEAISWTVFAAALHFLAGHRNGTFAKPETLRP